MTIECIEKEFGVTVGRKYKVLGLESQGDFYRIINDFGEESNYAEESFSVVKNEGDIKAKCRYSVNADLLSGKVYDVVSVDNERKECRVIDESGEDYIYPMDCFEFFHFSQNDT